MLGDVGASGGRGAVWWPGERGKAMADVAIHYSIGRRTVCGLKVGAVLKRLTHHWGVVTCKRCLASYDGRHHSRVIEVLRMDMPPSSEGEVPALPGMGRCAVCRGTRRAPAPYWVNEEHGTVPCPACTASEPAKHSGACRYCQRQSYEHCHLPDGRIACFLTSGSTTFEALPEEVSHAAR